MVKQIAPPPTMMKWLKQKPDEIDLQQQRLALAEYIDEEGLQDNLPKPGIELWREILPRVARRINMWRIIKSLQIKYTKNPQFKGYIDNLRNTLRSNDLLNEALKQLHEEQEAEYDDEEPDDDEEEQEAMNATSNVPEDKELENAPETASKMQSGAKEQIKTSIPAN